MIISLREPTPFCKFQGPLRPTQQDWFWENILLHQTPRVQKFYDVLVICFQLLLSTWIPYLILLLFTCSTPLFLYCSPQYSRIPDFSFSVHVLYASILLSLSLQCYVAWDFFSTQLHTLLHKWLRFLVVFSMVAL